MIVRDYTPDDLASVVNLFQRSVHEVACRDYTPEQVGAWAPDPPDVAGWSRRLSSEAAFVCEHRGRVAGCARVEANGHIDLLYVDPESQGQGVARALCTRVVERALARNLTRLFTEASVTARPFFERAGFHVVRSCVVERRGVRLPNFEMERAL